MANPAPHFFKHLTIAVHPEDLAGVLRKCTLPQRIGDVGGRLMFWEDRQKENYTHLIARNSQTPLAVWARDSGKTVVSLLWVWDCLEAGRLLPVVEEQLYSLDFRIPSAHSTQEITITATGYSGIQRHIYLQMLETAGMKVVKEMHPFETTHILAADVHDKSSSKIKRALLPDVLGRIRIVNVLWLYDCLRQSCILPTGGYERNPPEDMDPAKGALAIDARLQTVAASDSSEGSPSQPAESSGPPASRSAAPQMPETACTASAVNAPGQRHGEARDLQDTSAATAIDLERRRRAVPSVNGFQPQHLDRQQAPRSAAAQQQAGNPEGDPIEECSPQQLPGNGWRRRKSLKHGSGRSARPLADIANSSPAVPDVVLRSPYAATGAAVATASTSSVPLQTADGEPPPAPAAQAQPRVPAAQHRVQQLGTTAQAQLDAKGCLAAQQRTQEPEPPTTELGAAGDPGAAAGCVPSRGAEDLCCSEPDSCANMSQRVAGAEAAVALLVEQVGPSESAAGLGADDETDSDLGATVADSGKRRQQASAAKDHGRMQTLQDAAAGKAQPFGRKQQTVAGAKCNKRLCVAVEERPALPAWMANQGPEQQDITQQRPEQVEPASRADRRIPVNLDAPLASQADREMQEEGNLEAADVRGPRLEAAQDHKGAPREGVLWKALPIKRAARSLKAPGRGRQKPGRGVKRASAAPRQDPLIGRRLQKTFQDGKYEGRVESHDADAGYFRIVFEEDDSEEMSRAQLEPLLLPDVDDTDVESPPAAAEPPAAGSAAEQPRATAAAALPPPQAGEGPAKGCAARKGCKRRVVAGAPRVDAAEHADKRRKGSRAAARPAAAGKSPGRGRLPALGDANGQLPSASKRRQGEECPEGAVQASNRKSIEANRHGSKGTKAATTEAAKQAAKNKAPVKRPSGKGATPAVVEARPVKRRPVFAVSSMHTDERDAAAETLRSLKVGVSVDLHSHQWEARITHLLLPGDWVRGAKVLAAMAAGSWLLSTDYLAACTKNHALLEEEDYEIATNRKNTVSRGSPRHWRLRRKLHGQAAFQGLKAVVHGDFEEGLRPRRDEVVSILQAGGATLLTVNQALSLGVHFVVTNASRPKTDTKVKQLMGAGLCIVSPHFVVNWIAHPWTTPTKHTLHGSRMGSDLTAAAKARGELQAGTEAAALTK